MNEYYEILNGFKIEFSREFGERKFDEISYKVLISKKISGLICKAQKNELPLLSGDIVSCVLKIPSFIISNNMKVAMASFLVFERWNQECNRYEEYLSYFEMCTVLTGIHRLCGQMF